jgi:ABC-type phosphate transport system auxiliary subunit
MWKKAIERERNTTHFNKLASSNDNGVEENLEKKTQEFQKILEVSSEERDRIQRLQVIDRASAAIAAARALLKDANSNSVRSDGDTLQKYGTFFLFQLLLLFPFNLNFCSVFWFLGFWIFWLIE